jgi:membrane peptidoglycan carboxypeptidase
MIAGIVPNPTNWDPINNHDQAAYRWDRTLDFMYEDGHIDKAQYDEALAAGFPEPVEYTKSQRYALSTGYLLRLVEEELAESDNPIDFDSLSTGGYTVVTTIDKTMQDAAVSTAESLPRAERGDENPVSENIRAAIVSIDPNDGSIRALYGGRDFVQNEYNNATRGAAQGGSTFKPFTLIAGLENGHQLDERFDGNSPKTFPGADNGSDWKVRNFSDHDWGNIDLTEATAQSVNTAYAELNLEVGPEKTADVAARLGIKADVGSNLANVLGDATVTPLELTNAYATIAAQGMRSTPHIVATVTDSRGNLVYQAPGADKRQQEFDPEVMAAATYALSQVVEQGSGEPAQAIGRPAAGKTGTSTDNKSAWFAGFTPGLATVVGLYQSGPEGEQEQITPFGKWVGDEITGGSWPVEAWTSYMQAATVNLPVGEFPAYTPPKPKPTETPTETPTEEPTEETPTEEPEEPQQPENVTVPGDLQGRTIEDAKAALRALGLKWAVTEEFSNEPRGIVIKVLSASAQVPPGSTISLVVSKGVDPGQEPPDPENPDPENPDPSPTETPPDGSANPGGNQNNNRP